MLKHRSDILALAKRGAEVRFHELMNELTSLTSSFPHLRDSVSQDDLRVNFLLRRGSDKAARAAASQPKRRKLSAKARAAISAAQKARWAKLKSKKQ
jgi:hypothetical protein